MPEMLGGSADLTGSVNTARKDSVDLTTENFHGNYVYYGVREFGMTAIMNGLTVHGGFRPYGGTFLVFSDYARNAVRVAAIMHCPTTLVYTARFHRPRRRRSDASARRTSGLACAPCPTCTSGVRCDAVESAVSWIAALERQNGPTALVFTRQGLPQQARTPEQLGGAAQGRLRAHRQQRSAGGHRDRHRLRSRRRGAEAVRELQAAGKRVRLGVHALLRSLRCAARAVSRERAAGLGDAPPGGGGGRHAVVVALRRLAAAA